MDRKENQESSDQKKATCVTEQEDLDLGVDVEMDVVLQSTCEEKTCEANRSVYVSIA